MEKFPGQILSVGQGKTPSIFLQVVFEILKARWDLGPPVG